MPATITLYQSTDASAPALSNTAGSLIAVLKACLVDGYGAKAAAGWTEEYTGTNKSAFRMATGVGKNGVYLRVDDTAVGNSNFRGFATMSDVDTGTEPFGTDSTACCAVKAAGVSWRVVATDTYFYLFISTAGGSFQSSSGTQMFFGQFNTPLDLSGRNNCLLARTGTNSSTNAFGIMLTTTLGTVQGGLYFHCSYDGLYGGAPNGMTGSKWASRFSSISMAVSLLDYPAYDTGALEGSLVSLNVTSSYSKRVGYLPGAFEAHHIYNVIAEASDIVGIGDAVFWMMPAYSSTTPGGMMIQVAGTPI